VIHRNEKEQDETRTDFFSSCMIGVHMASEDGDDALLVTLFGPRIDYIDIAVQMARTASPS
jgi:hypothetical protein